jgi:hypothetical protein
VNEEFEQPVPECQEVVRAVRRLTERDDERVADDGFDRLEIREPVAGLDRRQADRMVLRPRHERV